MIAEMYRANRYTGEKPSGAISSMQAIHNGPHVSCHSAAPPPVEEYEAWLSANLEATNPLGRGKTPISASALRRMVVMRRQGCTYKQCAAPFGRAVPFARKWLLALPDGLSA